MLLNSMMTWKKNLNYYGLSNLVIIFLFIMLIISVISEVVSIGMFLPLFELINQHGVKGISDSDSDIVIYISNFMHFIGVDLNVEVLLSSSFVLFLISKILLYSANYIQIYYRGLITKNMKDKLLDKYLKADSSYYDIVSIGDFTNSSSVELPAAVNGVMLPIKFIITIMSGVGSIVILFIMSYQLTLLSICIIGFGVILPVRWVKATTKAGKKNSRYSSTITSFLLDRLQSPRLVRLSNMADMEEKDYKILTEKQRKLSLAIQLLKARITLFIEPTIIGISLLMFYVALVIIKMPVSSILLYMIIMIRIVPIITNILTQKQGINRATGPIQAIDRLMVDIDKSINNREKSAMNKSLRYNINKVESLRLEDVYFNYNNTENILYSISYAFKKSTLTAIVGPSGSGKTTFVDIISGYREPTSGNLFVNEVNVNKYNPEFLTSLISYVPQDPQIFDGTTIYEHITYGNLNFTKDDVINATKLSGAYNFIKGLTQGFDTVLTGGISSLSGGQKQRIDLARALLRNKPILIMDEPTGNLDLISEKEVMSNIKKIRKKTNKIIIIIAHRMHAIMDADYIVVMEDGRISGIGTHSKLLLSNSWYKKAVTD